jgi:dihydroxyacetone kinase-like protein
MKTPKKLLNDPKNIVSETLDGLVAAYCGKVRRMGTINAIVANGLPDGKVGLLIGGGSGHEPLFAGLVGSNLADGAVAGGVFAAPTPDQILAATRELNRGGGVLYVYGNYAGDNMNFDMAAELAAEEGITTKSVRVWDNVASAPPDKVTDRRGIAGDLFVIKIAGAACASETLEEAYRVTCKARDNTRSIGVALAPGTFPETGKPGFELADDEMEIGLGLHGEAGVGRFKVMTADRVVDLMLDQITRDQPLRESDEVCVLINNLGSTTMMELLILNRRVNQVLSQKRTRVHDTVVGTFCTSQEMAGFSISLMKLDDELKRYYEMPARSLAFTR